MKIINIVRHIKGQLINKKINLNRFFYSYGETYDINEIEKFLLPYKNNKDNNVLNQSEKALMFCILYGKNKMAKELCEKGVNIDVNNQMTLKLAIMSSNLEMIKYLFEKKITINQSIAQELVTINVTNAEIYKYIVDQFKNMNLDLNKSLNQIIYRLGAGLGYEDPMYISEREDSLKIIDIILEKNEHMHINAELILWAAQHKEKKLVEKLLNNNKIDDAEKFIKSLESLNKLMNKIEHIILNKGIFGSSNNFKMNTMNSNNLFYTNGNPNEIELFDIIKLILAQDKVWNGLGDNKYDYLNTACRCGSLELCQIFVERGIDIAKETNKTLIYAFENACCYGNVELVKYFIENGFKINKETSEALILAGRDQRYEIINYLLAIKTEVSETFYNSEYVNEDIKKYVKDWELKEILHKNLEDTLVNHITPIKKIKL